MLNLSVVISTKIPQISGLPQLQPGDVIIIDNASFHRSQVIDEIVTEAGCEL